MTIRMFSPTPRGSTAGHGSLAALLVVGGVAMVLSGAQPSSTDLALMGPATPTPHAAWTDAEDAREILDTYCVWGHNETLLTA